MIIQRRIFPMRVGLLTVLIVSLTVSIGCSKSENDTNNKDATGVVTPMNIQTDVDDGE